MKNVLVLSAAAGAGHVRAAEAMVKALSQRDMDEWMAAADIMVGKAGGLTSSEALARGLVLFIVNPIPRQEERNTDHFLEEGVAFRCNNLPAFAYKLETLLGDGPRFEHMKQNALRIARPNAAADIAGLVASRIS